MGENRDRSRITPDGKAIGVSTARIVELGQKRLNDAGLVNLNIPTARNEMCKSCAGRLGTVPNGCMQTQLDFLKAVHEGEKFLCHAPKDGRICAGFLAARAECVAKPLPEQITALLDRWEYSPPD